MTGWIVFLCIGFLAMLITGIIYLVKADKLLKDLGENEKRFVEDVGLEETYKTTYAIGVSLTVIGVIAPFVVIGLYITYLVKKDQSNSFVGNVNSRARNVNTYTA